LAFRADIDEARRCGWEPTPEHILCGFNMCIAETDEKARDILAQGVRYFMQVLMAPQRQAQNMVLTKTRYYSSAVGGETFLKRLAVAGTRTIDDAIRDGTILCGSPETVVKQIKRIHAELGCGWINTNMKIGTVPNEAVIKGMEMFRDFVQPEVRDLGRVSSQAAE